MRRIAFRKRAEEDCGLHFPLRWGEKMFGYKPKGFHTKGRGIVIQNEESRISMAAVLRMKVS